MAAMVMLTLVTCGGVELPAGGDLDAVLDELRDCDTLSETFVGVVREAAEDLDQVAAASGGRIPAPELADRVDTLTSNSFFAIAERLGCDVVAARLRTIDGLRQISTDTAAGDELVEEVIREMENADPS